MNPWQQIHQHQRAMEMAERNGFLLEQERDGDIAIAANKAPYNIGCAIMVVSEWQEVIAFFVGYEQHMFELENTK